MSDKPTVIERAAQRLYEEITAGKGSRTEWDAMPFDARTPWIRGASCVVAIYEREYPYGYHPTPIKMTEDFAKILRDIFTEEEPRNGAWSGWIKVAQAIERRLAPVEHPEPAPIPMLLWCPGCNERHIDVGDFATKPHHTHACQSCGMVWRPAKVDTVGVDFLPGYKNTPPREDDAGDRDQTRTVTRCRAWSYPGHKSWDCELHGKPDGRQCALDRGHDGPHELTGTWTRGDYPGERR